jgi:hypothetical protein
MRWPGPSGAAAAAAPLQVGKALREVVTPIQGFAKRYKVRAGAPPWRARLSLQRAGGVCAPLATAPARLAKGRACG